jgi:hypothetical protein
MGNPDFEKSREERKKVDMPETLTLRAEGVEQI